MELAQPLVVSHPPQNYSTPKSYAFFIDVETSGPKTNDNFLIQVAMIFVSLDCKHVISKYSFFLPASVQDGKEWNTETEAFWKSNRMRNKYDKAMLGMSKQPFTPAHLFGRLIEWMEDKYAQNSNIYLMSDNPAFDIQWIQYHFPKNKSINMLSGYYSHIVDIRSWTIGLAREAFISIPHGCSYGIAEKNLSHPYAYYSQLSGYVHDHDALNDTMGLYDTVIILLEKLKMQFIPVYSSFPIAY